MKKIRSPIKRENRLNERVVLKFELDHTKGSPLDFDTEVEDNKCPRRIVVAD